MKAHIWLLPFMNCLYCFVISQTQHLGRYEPSSPSTKEVKGCSRCQSARWARYQGYLMSRHGLWCVCRSKDFASFKTSQTRNVALEMERKPSIYHQKTCKNNIWEMGKKSIERIKREINKNDESRKETVSLWQLRGRLNQLFDRSRWPLVTLR